jgi:glycosyltransferase involved in cell wall biosynthesis
MVVSVLMATYINDDRFLLGKALQSILDQTIQCSELVIVEDGALTDELYSVIDSYRDKLNIISVVLDENYGLATALNEGLKHISNDIVLRADSDDINNPVRFERQIQPFIEGYELVGGMVREVGKKGEHIAYRIVPESIKDILNFSKNRNPFNHMTIGFIKKVVLDAGGYPNIHLKEDYALWATLLSNGVKAKNLNEIFVDATTGSDMYRRRGGLKYVRSEFEMQRHLVNCGLKNWFSAFLVGVIRSLVFLMPCAIRGYIYEKVLRK